MKRLVNRLIVAGSLMALFGCGGGGGGGVQSIPSDTKTVEVKLSSQGTLPQNTTIAGIGVTVELPAGVSLKTDAAGKVVAGSIAPSGVAEGKGTIADPIFEPATTSTKAKLSIVIASTLPGLGPEAGFGTGEFATLRLNVAATANPTATDFTVPAEDFKPVDPHGVAIPGITVTHTADVK